MARAPIKLILFVGDPENPESLPELVTSHIKKMLKSMEIQVLHAGKTKISKSDLISFVSTENLIAKRLVDPFVSEVRKILFGVSTSNPDSASQSSLIMNNQEYLLKTPIQEAI